MLVRKSWILVDLKFKSCLTSRTNKPEGFVETTKFVPYFHSIFDESLQRAKLFVISRGKRHELSSLRPST